MKITATQYAKSLYESTVGKPQSDIAGIVANFIRVLDKNRQLKLSSKVIDRFDEIWNTENGIIEAKVTSMRKLEEQQVHKIEKFLQEKYAAKKVILQNKVDEKIRGGLIIRVGNEVLDGSMMRQLLNLRNKLIA